ncbi:hypothetical protein GCM10029964_047670 [Kibdelosporangium lantanae]
MSGMITAMAKAISRRSALRGAAGVTVVAGAGLATTAGPASAASAPEPVFRHGIASGDPLPDSVLLWTRVTPTPDATPGSGRGPDVTVRWEVATDAAFNRVVACGSAQTGPDRDHTVKVNASDLRPASAYYYRFICRGQVSPVGRTRTAPEHDADVANLRFGVVSCSHLAAGYFAAYRFLSERDDLFAVIHLGDYIYEGPPFAGEARLWDPPAELETLADYRRRHAQYKAEEHVQKVHARHPVIATWDDHEAADNDWSGGSYVHDPATEGPWSVRLAGAHQAYFEWMPVRHRGQQLYRRFKFGKLIDLTMMDLRSYRTQQPTPGTQDPAGTILGPDQRSWLLNGIEHGTAAWNLLGNSVMFAPMTVPVLPQQSAGAVAKLLASQPLATTVNTDQWDGYAADRRIVVDAIARQGNPTRCSSPGTSTRRGRSTYQPTRRTPPAHPSRPSSSLRP